MTTSRWWTSHSKAMAQLYEDVGRNSFKQFRVSELPSGVVDRLGAIHPEVAEKASQFTVVTSGADEANRHWMIIFAHRVDHQPGTSQKVTDLDPVVTFFDANGDPALSGVVTHHASYLGRTEPAGHYETIPEAVAGLQSALVPTSGCYDQADDRVKAGARWAVHYFRSLE